MAMQLRFFFKVETLLNNAWQLVEVVCRVTKLEAAF